MLFLPFGPKVANFLVFSPLSKESTRGTARRRSCNPHPEGLPPSFMQQGCRIRSTFLDPASAVMPHFGETHAQREIRGRCQAATLRNLSSTTKFLMRLGLVIMKAVCAPRVSRADRVVCMKCKPAGASLFISTRRAGSSSGRMRIECLDPSPGPFHAIISIAFGFRGMPQRYGNGICFWRQGDDSILCIDGS